jgi:hypothetical protein
MVDINLIGDEKTGEEERVEEFTQTSSMDTQELAFEERTETFDTTKTASLTRRRNYSSLVSTLIIVAVILLLGSAIYFFLLRGDGEADLSADLQGLPPSAEQVIPETASEQDLQDLQNLDLSEPLPDLSQGDQPVGSPEVIEPSQPSEPIRQQIPPEQEIVSIPPATGSRSADIDAGSARYLANTRAAIQTVNSLVSMVPANLSVTLLSHSGNRVRMEFVAQSQAQAGDFTSRLRQNLGGSSFKVISDNAVASNGGSVQKVLVAGRSTASGSAAASGRIEYLDSRQASDWIKNTARQYGLSVIQLNTQQASFIEGLQKTPVFARLSGSKAAVSGMLEELASQSMNLELAKIILVSPDHIYYKDDTLVLVLNLFLYER